MADVHFRAAPEVADIARDLIRDYHQHLSPGFFEKAVRIEYVFTDKESKRNGKVVLGKAVRVSSLNAFLAGKEQPEKLKGEPLFVVVIWSEWWNAQRDLDKKKALVDHELSHCQVDEVTDDDGRFLDLKLSIRAHDVEEFSAVIKRWGLWKSDLEDFAKHIPQQPSLFDDAVRNSPISVSYNGQTVETTAGAMDRLANASDEEWDRLIARAPGVQA